MGRRQRSRGEGDDGDENKAEASTAKPTETTHTETTPVEGGQPPVRASTAEDPTDTELQPLEPADMTTQPVRPSAKDLPAIEPPAPHAEPWPDATPQPMKPVEPPEPEYTRPRAETVAMPTVGYGRPPEMPKTAAPPPLVLGDVENPAHMPGPREVPSGDPDDPAPAPGHVPPGDSRSLRRGDEFALIYRVGTCVISRSGRVGTRGQWRVVEYPTSAAAASSYAKECSRFVYDGFTDYRD